MWNPIQYNTSRYGSWLVIAYTFFNHFFNEDLLSNTGQKNLSLFLFY